MKILERIQKKHRDFHTSIVSSFTSSLSAYEDLLLHRIEQSGTYNNILLVDQRMYREEMNGLKALLRGCQNKRTLHAGHRYSLYPIAVTGAFHPKIYLFLGRNKAQMYLGSANVSPAALGRNRELMFELECSSESSSERTIIKQAFHFLLDFLTSRYGESSMLKEQVDFIRRESGWLFEENQSETQEGLLSLSDGTEASLLLSGTSPSTLERVLELVEGEEVEQLTILSPYWDGNLSTLKTLQESLKPRRTNLMIQPGRTEVPVKELQHLPAETNMYRTFADDGFMHAKMILISTAHHDHLICGSANCTSAALGSATAAPINAEASVYRRLPAGVIISELGLEKSLDPQHLLLPGDLPEPPSGDRSSSQKDITTPTEKHPGTVEMEGNSIHWLPAPGIAEDRAVLIMLNEEFEPLGELNQGSANRYLIPEKTVGLDIALVQFRLGNGEMTSPVFVHHKQVLRRSRYKSGNSVLRGLIEKYEQGAPIGMDLFELVMRIESENKNQLGRKQASRPSSRRNETDEGQHSAEMEYEEFVHTSPVHNKHHSNVGLTHGELMPVRDILNRVFAKSYQPVQGKNVYDDNHLYDEEAAAETLAPDQATEAFPELPDDYREKIREGIAYQRAQIIKAIDNYVQELKAKADGPIQAIDLLKLRLLLEIILSSTMETEDGYSIIRIVPEYRSDRDTLCHLAGKVLFAFFAGSRPPVDRVILPEGLEAYPIDYLETWVCCQWTIQLLGTVALANSDLNSLLPSLKKLDGKIDENTLNALTPIQRGEVDDLMSGMAKRYGDRT